MEQSGGQTDIVIVACYLIVTCMSRISVLPIGVPDQKTLIRVILESTDKLPILSLRNEDLLADTTQE